MAQLTDTQISLRAGKHRAYMAKMKEQNPKRYAKIRELGGIEQYETWSLQITHRLAEIYYELLDAKQINAFSRYLAKQGVMSDGKNVLNDFFNRFAFRSEGALRLQTIEKIERMLECYEEFKGLS